MAAKASSPEIGMASQVVTLPGAILDLDPSSPDRAVGAHPAAPISPDPRRSRRVLMIVSRFPPVASVGALRIRKFAKYLGAHGWQPVVMTGAPRRGSSTSSEMDRAGDPAGLLDVPASVPINRLRPSPRDRPRLAARRIAAFLSRWASPLGVSEDRWRRALEWRVRRLHDRLAFPDPRIHQLPEAVALARAMHRRCPFDAVFSSGMPFSDHLVALVAQAVIRRPWVADFRDPWAEYVHDPQWRGPWGRRLTYLAEAAVMRRAARVVSVNDAMTRRFQDRYRRLPPGRFVTIPNGFDSEDLPSASEYRPGPMFRLLYAGSLYGARSPDMLLAGFHRFLDATPGSRQRVRLEFAGRAGSHAGTLARAAADGPVEYLGCLSHGDALRRMARADVNVVLLPNVPGGEADSTAKIYECIGIGRPLLAVVPLAGAAAAELRGLGGVRLCAPDDIASIAEAIAAFYRDWLAGAPAPERSAAALHRHTRRSQAARLAALLDTVVAARTGRGGGGAPRGSSGWTPGGTSQS